jgi:PLP dependent protein
MSVRENLRSINSKLPGHCKLIAVTKTHPTQTIKEAYEAGHRLFGENKVQELVPKYESLPKDIEWHLIGHLQSNKVKYVVPFVSLIHSVDSQKLLEEINKQSLKAGRVVDCLLQVHIAKEETKFGLSESEVLDLLMSSDFQQLRNVRIKGLMGMATLTENKETIRNEFKGLKAIFERIKKSQHLPNISMVELSMGMSGDYEIAVEEGSTLVRIGSAIFGHREYNN